MAAKKRTKRRTMFQETWHRLLKNKGAVIGMAFLALLCVIALVSPFVFNYETDVIGQNLAIKLQPPSGEHWFGTDEYGRDLFARVMYGARYSMAIGIGSVGFGLIVGTILGSIAGFYGGKADDIIMRGSNRISAGHQHHQPDYCSGNFLRNQLCAYRACFRYDGA